MNISALIGTLLIVLGFIFAPKLIGKIIIKEFPSFKNEWEGKEWMLGLLTLSTIPLVPGIIFIIYSILSEVLK